MANYFLTNKALEDLSKIWDYTYEVWSEYQADKYYYELLEDCEQIVKNNSLGKNYQEIDSNIFGYQFGQHIIFYRILNNNGIEITRFLHPRMDLKKRIQE